MPQNGSAADVLVVDTGRDGEEDILVLEDNGEGDGANEIIIEGEGNAGWYPSSPSKLYPLPNVAVRNVTGLAGDPANTSDEMCLMNLVDGCTKTIYARGLCKTHCRKPCSMDGCRSGTIARGLCSKHGARGECSIIDCSTNARKKGGYCARHGGLSLKPCSVDGCATKATARGLCGKHGAKGKCLINDCSTNAQKKGGFCARHGGGLGKCSVSDCNVNAQKKGGRCRNHGDVGGGKHHGGGTSYALQHTQQGIVLC